MCTYNKVPYINKACIQLLWFYNAVCKMYTKVSFYANKLYRYLS